ncbi:uncharacterized protein LOC106152920 isoform X2 [Lingula anatina]|uniref:Uncharacterized protein LOC106152920 isoform X1 n=1 Tax=Lingula anatina TaxID=7574 RepID=A0A1S3H811_LINAN|nr:uncharacterized protein LOC106152920 isoform X1 [Lingula anatina]XP_013382117.1 uncharacterized protein LOC106152920 isoform X2 [Lingula anatina]|eukprot:XP_013382116.1 uncharacterized protein LOC106152920 isoform X1 [Lingula anatina]
MKILFFLAVVLFAGPVQRSQGVDPGGDFCYQQKDRCSQMLPTMDLWFNWPTFNNTQLRDFCLKLTELKTCTTQLKSNLGCNETAITLEAESANAAYLCSDAGKKNYQDNLACFTESSRTTTVASCYTDHLEQAFLPPSAVDSADRARNSDSADEICYKLNEYVNCTGTAFSPCRAAAREVATMTALGLYKVYMLDPQITLKECAINMEVMITTTPGSTNQGSTSGARSRSWGYGAHVVTGMLSLAVLALS